MTVFVVEVIDLLLRPFFLGFSAALVGFPVLFWRQDVGYVVIGSGMAFLWVCATPWVGEALIGVLEEPFPPRHVNTISEAEAIVVLSGGLEPATGNRVYPDLNGAADRVWHAARLYNAGVAPVVIVSGGKPPRLAKSTAPAMKRLLESWGIPSDSVLIESRSRSTRENAVYTKQVCREWGVDRIALVTSAVHMRRALSAFRQVGFEEIVPAATDHSVTGESSGFFSILPGMRGLSSTTIVFREHAAYFYYWLRGWVKW
jgi:uncharacterized SAM-binding protein YcdF (DUF218 family)